MEFIFYALSNLEYIKFWEPVRSRQSKCVNLRFSIISFIQKPSFYTTRFNLAATPLNIWTKFLENILS